MTARGPRAWSREPFSAFRPASPWSSPARLIASGLGLPYNILSGDLSDTSYSSARVGLIEFRKYIDALEWQFIHMFCRPVFQRWVELEVLRGELPLPENGIQQYIRNVSWAPPAMQMTDPQREVDAMVRAIRAGLMSREMAVASLGYDLAEVDAQIAAGNAAADAAGIVLDSDPRRVTQQGNPTDPAPPGRGFAFQGGR